MSLVGYVGSISNPYDPQSQWIIGDPWPTGQDHGGCWPKPYTNIIITTDEQHVEAVQALIEEYKKLKKARKCKTCGTHQEVSQADKDRYVYLKELLKDFL